MGSRPDNENNSFRMERECSAQGFVDKLNADPELYKAFYNWLNVSHTHIHPPLFRLKYSQETLKRDVLHAVFTAFNHFVRETGSNESPIRLAASKE